MLGLEANIFFTPLLFKQWDILSYPSVSYSGIIVIPYKAHAKSIKTHSNLFLLCIPIIFISYYLYSFIFGANPRLSIPEPRNLDVSINSLYVLD